MRNRIGVCASLLTGWVVAGVVTPAVAGVEGIPTFRGGVDLVALNVTVTDPGEKYVMGLDASHFRVIEDGVPQDVSFFSSGQVPLDLTIILDASASVRDRMPAIHEAAIGFLGTLRPVDRGSIVAIKSNAVFLQALTNDQAELQQAVRSVTSSGATALYDAIYLSLRELVRQRSLTEEVRRQAMVVLSDGEDTSSLVGYDEVLELVRQSGVSIYTISMKPISEALKVRDNRKRFYSQADFTMKAFAQETGARSFFPLELRELNGVYANIAEELSNQYALGYISKNTRQDGAYRRILVQVALPGTRVRTRPGYLAPGRRTAALSSDVAGQVAGRQ